MKKLTCIVLILSLLLCGCSKTTDPTTDLPLISPEQNTPKPTPPPVQLKVEVTEKTPETETPEPSNDQPPPTYNSEVSFAQALIVYDLMAY